MRAAPDLPATFIETPAPELLWRRLRETCLDARTNADEARMNAALEPLVEVLQHKGSSECMRGADTNDELCGFEVLQMSNFDGRYVPYTAEKSGPRQFVRAILREGLAQEAKLGVNPFKYGMVVSTDTRVGASGAVEEDESYEGHGRAGTPARDRRPPGPPDAWDFNPGGLAGVRAEEPRTIQERAWTSPIWYSP